jgi:hypothetical protein
MFLMKSRSILNGLHGVICQKIVLFIATAVRTSNPSNTLCWSYTTTAIDGVFSATCAIKVCKDILELLCFVTDKRRCN